MLGEGHHKVHSQLGLERDGWARFIPYNIYIVLSLSYTIVSLLIYY
jgi:hypothetical protein